MKYVPILFIFLFSSLAISSENPHPSAQLITPTSSPNDTRQYEYLTLKNRMKVLLISDPSADKAAASLSVNIGSASEPASWPGLAHFLEHMLFMGTKKYPDINDYQHYIGQNGGDTNAGTSTNITNFSFTIKPEKLQGALDRFSQFFTAPLIKPKYVEDEKHAVDSEYHLKIRDEGRRLHAAIQQAINPASPYSHFTVGNLETLADKPNEKVHDALVRFYRTHYSANLMGLVVLGQESLPQLRKMVTAYFADVLDRNVRPYTPTSQELAFPPDRLPATLAVRPLGNLRHVNLIFPIPSPRKAWRVVPIKYISTLLASANPGSFFDTVHSRGWVESLSVSGDTLDATQGEIDVDMALSPKGFKHLQEILTLFYAYVDRIRTHGIQSWRYKERQHLDTLLFRYAMREDPFDYVTYLSDRLHFYPPHDILTANRFLQHFDPEIIRRYLDGIRPNNALNVFIYPDAPTDKIAPRYQTPYAYKQLEHNETAPLLKPNDSHLLLPEKNPFVPKELTIKPLEHPARTKPIRLIDQTGLTLWHHQDDHFHVPRAGIRVLLRSPFAQDNARDTVLLLLWKMLTSERLSHIGEQALKAGLALEIKTPGEGLVYTLFGYDDKLPKLHDALLNALKKRTINPQRFSRIKRQLELYFDNLRNTLPFQQVSEALKRSYTRADLTPAQQQAALQTITSTDLSRYIDQYLNRLQVEMLTLGNLTDAQSKGYAHALQTTLLANTTFAPIPDPTIHLPKRDQPHTVTYPVHHTDSVAIQEDIDPKTDLDTWAHWFLASYIYKGEFYTQLRAREQLGYVVMAMPFSIQSHPGMVAIVESPNTSASEVFRHIAHFNNAFAAKLEHIDPKIFDKNIQGAVTTLSKEDTTLIDRMERYFDDILHDRFTFDFRQKLIQRIQTITPQELGDFFQKHMLEHPTRTYGTSPGAQDHNHTADVSKKQP